MYKKKMTWRIRVYGIVQGVGFRPTVSRHATAHGIYGTVCNKGPYVEIYAQGQKEKSLFPQISQSVMNVKKNCLIQKTDVTCIHLSIVPAAVQDLRFWMHCHMTGNVQV